MGARHVLLLVQDAALIALGKHGLTFLLLSYFIQAHG
jgi:hypothetical protein